MREAIDLATCSPVFDFAINWSISSLMIVVNSGLTFGCGTSGRPST